MIEVMGLSKAFGPTKAVNNLSFTVPEGRIMGLLGQNGAGKTTTLNMLTGCLAPDGGQVRLGGYDLISQPVQARRMLGYLPEKPPLYDEMTTRDYLIFAARLKEVDRRDIPDHINEVMAVTGLTDMADRLLGNLSKGYRQRAGLAQAMCGNPQVLVLDEPTVGLDPRQAAEIRELIRKIGKNHTVILSSHLLDEVQSICQQALILHHGKCVLSGTMAELTGFTGDVRLRVSLEGQVNLVLPLVKALPFVKKVQLLANETPGVLEAVLTCDSRAQPRHAMFEFCCEQHLALLRMNAEDTPLEDVFLRATREEMD